MFLLNRTASSPSLDRRPSASPRGSWKALTFAGLAAVLVLSGCTKETTSPEDETATPAVPSALSMTFDLGALGEEGGRPAAELLASSSQSSAASTRWHWLNAALRVAAINVVMAHVLSHPVEVIELALSADPEYIGDDTFRWRYVWSEGSENITIDLTGQVDTAALHWELRLTGKIDGRTLDNELWFYGDTNRQSESGFWVFSDLENNPTDVARIDWNLDDKDNRSLVFENINQSDPEVGDQLAYRVRTNTISVEVLDKSENELAVIEWDENTGAGSLIVPDYNDGIRACWDENQEDVECVEIGVAS